MSNELHLAPQTWMRETGVRLGDQVGWTDDDRILPPKDFQEPITRAEFIKRAEVSDVERWPDPFYDERPEPPDEFVSRLAEALKSEFGAQFGMGINAPDESWKRAARGMALKMRCEAEVYTAHEKWIGFRFNRRVSE